MQYAGPANPMGMSLARVTGGDEKSLRQFIAAHFGKSFAPISGETVVTIGQKPEGGIFADLPLPEHIQIIGTVERPQLHDEMIFRFEASETDFAASFVAALEEAGWKHVPMPSVQRGFMMQTTESIRLCHSDRGLMLQLAVAAGALAQLTIHKQHNPCVDPHQAHMQVMDVMPTLGPPQDIDIQSFQHGGGGSSSSSVHTSVSIKTSAGLAEIDAHYRQQLSGYGWTLSHQHTDEHLAVSTWRVTHEGELWRGLLLVIPTGEDGEMHLRLEMQVLDR
jgi:hypothetical protein